MYPILVPTQYAVYNEEKSEQFKWSQYYLLHRELTDTLNIFLTDFPTDFLSFIFFSDILQL